MRKKVILEVLVLIRDEFVCGSKGKVSAGGGCEAAIAARIRCGWVNLRVCGELLYGRRFPIKLNGAVCKC